MSTTEDKKPTGKSLSTLGGGARVQAIVPTTVGEIFRLGESIFESGLAPSGLDSASKVTIVMMKGMELGLPPMASLQSLGVINGKVCLYGDGIPSLLWARGFDIDESYTYSDEAKSLAGCVAHCKITRPGGKSYYFEYAAKDAIENGLWNPKDTSSKPWSRYTKRMLKMRCRGWLARDCASDVLQGIPIYEEVADMVDVTPKGGHYDAPLAVPDHIPDDLPELPEDVEAVSEAEDTQDPAITDAAVYLGRLETTLLNAAEDGQQDFENAWAEHVDTYEEKLSRTDRQKADALHDQVHGKYFSKPAEKPAASPKKGKKGEPGGSLI